MTIEDLFDAEASLRIAAREYSSAEHGMCSIEIRRARGRGLRVAARAYSKLADVFESALAESIAAKESGCGHLADSETPGEHLSPEPCANCGRYYADDVERAT